MRVVEVGGGAALEVHLQTRSSRPGVGGVREGALELKVNAPPVEGRANEAARRLLADLLDLAPSRVQLRSGAKARKKVFFIREIEPSDMRRRIGRLLKSP